CNRYDRFRWNFFQLGETPVDCGRMPGGVGNPNSTARRLVALCLVFGGAVGFAPIAQAEPPGDTAVIGKAGRKAENPYPHRIPSPPLEGAEWVNTPAPHTLAEFRGRFVLLDFWTFCCINCMHVLPELKKLEHAFPNELVVIGIHSAKFQGERDTDNIREAV